MLVTRWHGSSDLLIQGESQRQASHLAIVDRLIPTLRILAIALFHFHGPLAKRKGLQCHASHALRFRFGQNLRAEAAVLPSVDIDREQHAVQFERVHETESGGRAMGGETEMPDFALLPGRKKQLRSSGWRENLIDIFHRADGVKLVEIHMIGVETLQGALQLLTCTLRVAKR